jgi:hypothetical protein
MGAHSFLPSPALFISLHLVTDRSAPGVLTILDSYVDVYIYTVIHTHTETLTQSPVYYYIYERCVYIDTYNILQSDLWILGGWKEMKQKWLLFKI